MNNSFLAQLKIPATYMRGGTSKGVFFNLSDLPENAQVAGAARDALLLRVVGSPDPYAKHTDGMGGATSSTSKTVIVSRSTRNDHDVDYLFGQVAIDKAFVDWSGNCGNLTAAVGAFAIDNGLIDHPLITNKQSGVVKVNIWQVNIQKTIIAHIPITNGIVQESGDFQLDGVTFPAAEVIVEFLDPGDADGDLFPTGNMIDVLSVPGIGNLQATLINAGIPTIFINADEIGFTGTESQNDINQNPSYLSMFESIRAHGAIKMGLIDTIDQAESRQHTPKVAFVAPPSTYVSSSGKEIHESDVNVSVRALSMGKLHHAMMGTAAVAIGTAAAIPGTLVNRAAGGGDREAIVFGHPSGTLKVGACATKNKNEWQVEKVIMSRSARVIMEGMVRVPMEQITTDISN
jgi:hypothetical protein